MRTSPMKNTITMKVPMISSAENAMESGMARTRAQNLSGGMTCAVVLPISAETGTK